MCLCCKKLIIIPFFSSSFSFSLPNASSNIVQSQISKPEKISLHRVFASALLQKRDKGQQGNGNSNRVEATNHTAGKSIGKRPFTTHNSDRILIIFRRELFFLRSTHPWLRFLHCLEMGGRLIRLNRYLRMF